jgi:LytS/YehU family sensor histidine kinase
MLFTRRPQTRLLLHVLFWTLYLGFFTAVLHREMGWYEALFKVGCIGATYALFVYANLRWAIPRFLWQGRYATYGAIVAGLTMGCALAIWEVMELLSRFGTALMTEGIGFLPAIFNAAFMIFITSSAKLLLHSLEQQQVNRQLENQQLQTEINFLKSQVNPHFLFNTLNNLYALALTKDDRAPEIVLKLSAILRYMLYECNERFVHLNKEITYLRNYIELEEIRQGGRNEIILNVQGQTDRRNIAPLLFTPLLENAIKHGLNKTTGKAWVRIDLVMQGEELRFTIANSKRATGTPSRVREGVLAESGHQGGALGVLGTGSAVGRDAGHESGPSAEEPSDARKASEQRGERAGGIGLLNVKRRLDLLYPNRHVFRISEGADTYTVHLKLQLSE